MQSIPGMSHLHLNVAPANKAVEWELRKFDANDNQKGPFSGKPREEIDQNWHNLLNCKLTPGYNIASSF